MKSVFIGSPFYIILPVDAMRNQSATYYISPFRVRRSRVEMYSGHGRLCVCVSVCPSPHSHTTARTRM